MPDISMCENFECVRKNKCYRYLAVPGEYRQSYVFFNSENKEDCDFFWQIDPKLGNKGIRTVEEADIIAKRIVEQIRKEQENFEEEEDIS